MEGKGLSELVDQPACGQICTPLELSMPTPVPLSAQQAERQRIIAALRATADPATGKALRKQQFFALSGVSQHHFEKLFSSYQSALEAAQVLPRRFTDEVSQEELLAAYGGRVRELGRAPRLHEFANGKFHGACVRRLCGTFRRLPQIFRDWAEARTEWDDVRGLLGECRSGMAPVRLALPEPLAFKWMRHAPTNELGVILLFGQLCPQLGFAVETAQAAFPDCVALQQLAGGAWRRVRIEFEFESRNFAHHGHAPEECDLIVCWRHNWLECPAMLQVLALSDQFSL
jgi:hypothetical protein